MYDNYVCKYVIILKVIPVLPAWCAGTEILYMYLKHSHVNMNIVYLYIIYALDRCNS